MPNWCSSILYFYSENTAQIEAMYNRFKEIFDAPATQENGFGQGWMGDFANTYLPEYGAEKVSCRGSMEFAEEVSRRGKYTYFAILTETAWGPKIGMWYEITKRFYPDVMIAYSSEECGNEFFAKWDDTPEHIFCDEELYVDGCLPTKDNDETPYYIEERWIFKDINEIEEFLADVLPFSIPECQTPDILEKIMDELLAEYSANHDCDDEFYFTAAAFEKCPPWEYDFLK